MNNMVTVICMTYNHEKYIRNTLDSFLNQETDFPVEYIIRDDASTDHTAEIMREYERDNPGFFHMIYETENTWKKQEIPYFSQKVILETESKYVAFCEGDDYWCDKKKLQKQVDMMEEHTNASFCVHAHKELNDVTQKMKNKYPYKKTGFISIEEVLLEPWGMPSTCSMLIRTDMIRKYPIYELPCPVGDRSRRMFLIDQGPAIYINEIMGVYRVNNSSSFGGRLMDYKRSEHLVELMNSFFDKFNEYTEFRYDKYISLLKEREFISHYTRFGEYDLILNTEYYKKYFSFRAKIKLFIKRRLSVIYREYMKRNKLR